MNLILPSRSQKEIIRTRIRIRRKKRKTKKTVGAIVELIPITPTTDEPDPAENEVPDSDNDDSVDNNSDASSEGDNSSKEDDIEADMRRVFALIDFRIDKVDAKFDPEAKEERYYDECNEAFNDNQIVGGVVA